MIALDTNILARFLLNDDPEQYGFGDSLHLALSASDEFLVTFDRDFANVAVRAAAFPEVRSIRGVGRS
jgi:predicted nucleic acid-binding protein